MKHTEGPWQFYQTQGEERVITRIASLEDQIAVIEMTESFATKQDVQDAVLANARLIAAAPELLSALEKLVELTNHLANRGVASTTIVRAIDKAYFAIDKARGGS